jgi:uncharacterized protein
MNRFFKTGSAAQKPCAFLILSFALAWSVDWQIITSGVSTYQSTFLVGLRMWMPGIAAVVLSLIYRDRSLLCLIRTVPRLRLALIAYFFPVVVGLASLGLFLLVAHTTIAPRPEFVLKYGGLNPFLLRALVYAPTVGLLAPLVSSLGEEMGWRGFLYEQTDNLSPFRRKLLNGSIWAIYHWPLIIFSDYVAAGNRAIGLAVFSLMIVGSTFLICWLQDHSKSLWTSVVFHGAHNLWVIGIFPAFYSESGNSKFWLGEGGILLAGCYLVAAFVVTLKDRLVSSGNPI